MPLWFWMFGNIIRPVKKSLQVAIVEMVIFSTHHYRPIGEVSVSVGNQTGCIVNNIFVRWLLSCVCMTCVPVSCPCYAKNKEQRSSNYQQRTNRGEVG